MTQADLEARVQALDDREAIRELIMCYGYLEDARRWDHLLGLCTDDIERVLAGTLVETVTGKDALRDRLVSPVMARASGEGEAPAAEWVNSLRIRHLICGEVITLADDGASATATAQYTLVATRRDDDGFHRGAHEGSYEFELRKEHGRWRFCRQVIITNNAHNPMFQRR